MDLILPADDATEPTEEERTCHECGEPFQMYADGTAEHEDIDVDLDHVPYTLGDDLLGDVL